MSSKLWLFCGAFYGLSGVVLGAFGAHALRARLSEELLRAWHTGVEYQFYHALALLVVGLLGQTGSLAQGGWLTAGGVCLVAGVLLFSGSLYGLALGGPRLLGPVTPLGGLLLIAGWACLLMAIAQTAD